MIPNFLRPEVVPYASVEVVRVPPCGPEAAVPCSHRWVDPADAPIDRVPYSPWIGPRWRELKPGRLYRCANGCGAVLNTPNAEGR